MFYKGLITKNKNSNHRCNLPLVKLKFNKAYKNVNGIEIENCTNVVVTKNQCYNNTAGILAVVLPGLTVKELNSIQIIHNHVYDNNHLNFAEEEGGFEGLVPSGSGILFVGGDNSLIEDNNVKGNNFVGIAVVSTLVLGQLGEDPIPPEAFADIEPLPNDVKVISNVVMKNGAAPPKGLPLPGVDLLWMAQAQVIAGRRIIIKQVFLKHCQRVIKSDRLP